MSNNTKDTEQLKIYNSPIYRQKIKRMVEMTKTVRGIYGKIPRGKLPPLKNTATNREKEARQAQEKLRLTIDTIHYFAHPFSSHGYSSKPNNDTSPQTDELPSVP